MIKKSPFNKEVGGRAGGRGQARRTKAGQGKAGQETAGTGQGLGKREREARGLVEAPGHAGPAEAGQPWPQLAPWSES